MPSSRATLVLLVLLACSACSGSKPLTRGEKAESVGREAEGLMDSAEANLKNLEPDPAEEKLKEAERLLSDPIIAAYPDRQFLKEQLERAKARVPEVREEVRQRELEKAVSLQTQKVADAVESLEAIISPVDKIKGSVKREQVDQVTAKLEILQAALDDGDFLKSKDESYKAYSDDITVYANNVLKRIGFAENVVAFNEGPAALSREAHGLQKKGKAEKDIEQRHGMYVDAQKKLKQCASDGKSMIRTTKKLAKIKFSSGRKSLSAKALAKDCTKQAKKLSKVIKKLTKKLRKMAKKKKKKKKKKKRKKK